MLSSCSRHINRIPPPERVKDAQHKAPPLFAAIRRRRPAARAALQERPAAAAAGHAVGVAPSLQGRESCRGAGEEAPAHLCVWGPKSQMHPWTQCLPQAACHLETTPGPPPSPQMAPTPGSTALSPLMPRKKAKGTSQVVSSRNAAMYSTAVGRGSDAGLLLPWKVLCCTRHTEINESSLLAHRTVATCAATTANAAGCVPQGGARLRAQRACCSPPGQPCAEDGSQLAPGSHGRPPAVAPT